jgi:hypothetical protein
LHRIEQLAPQLGWPLERLGARDANVPLVDLGHIPLRLAFAAAPARLLLLRERLRQLLQLLGSLVLRAVGLVGLAALQCTLRLLHGLLRRLQPLGRLRR